MCTKIHVQNTLEVLLIIAISYNEGEVKINYIYCMEYYETIKKNEINLYVERVPGHCKCEKICHQTEAKHDCIHVF